MFSHDKISIKSLVFIKGEFLQSENKITLQNYIHDNTYFNVLIQNIRFKMKNKESTEKRKASFSKEMI